MQRNLHIDTKLAGLELVLEAGSSGTGTSKDGSTVAVLVGVDEGDGLIDAVNFKADEDGAEDLFAVAFHVWLDAGDNGWADLELNCQRCVLISIGCFSKGHTQLPLGYLEGL